MESKRLTPTIVGKIASKRLLLLLFFELRINVIHFYKFMPQNAEKQYFYF